MGLVASKYTFQQWQAHIAAGTEMDKRPRVLREAGAAKGEARSQIGVRNVQLPVLTDYSHDLPPIHAIRFQEAADLESFPKIW